MALITAIVRVRVLANGIMRTELTTEITKRNEEEVKNEFLL